MILIIHRFCIWKFTYPWSLFTTPKAILEALSQFLMDISEYWKTWVVQSEQEEKEMEDEMVGWHHWLNGQEFKQTLGHGERQGSLACCSPWSCKESDTVGWLNTNKGNFPGLDKVMPCLLSDLIMYVSVIVVVYLVATF